jgi:TctA family transporter
MNNRIDELLLTFIVLVMTSVIGIDRFVVETSLTQFFTGVLTGLLIVSSIVYIYRISSHIGQRQ